MKKLISHWNSFWFRPMSPEPLALARIWFFAFTLWYATDVGGLMFKAQFGQWEPIGIYRLLPGPFEHSFKYPIVYIWYALCVLCLIGLGSRISLKLSAVIGVLILGYNCNFGKVYHSTHLPAMILLVLGFSRAGSTLSVDQYIRKDKNPPPLSDFRWPFQLCKAYIVWSYFINGADKL